MRRFILKGADGRSYPPIEKRWLVRGSLLAALPALLAIVFASYAFADTIILKSGEEISGEKVAEFGEKVVIKLDTGGKRTVRKEKIDRIVEAGEGIGINESEVESGPTLEQLTLEAVRKLLEGDSELQGIILQQAKGKVYIDLGKSHGVKPGDIFDVVESGTEIRHPVSGEVLGVDRKAMARLRVVQVQDKLSICEVTSGKLPSPLPSGAGALRVLRQQGSGAKVGAGAVEAKPGTMVREEALKAAVDTALHETGKHGAGQDVPYRIDTEAVRGRKSVTVRLALVSNGTGSTINQTSFSFMPQTRYRTAFETTLKYYLHLDPIAVQAQRSYNVERGGDYVLIKGIGADSHDVAVMNDGRCFVLLKTGLKSLKDVDQAFGSFQLVTNSIIKPVRADIGDDAARQSWYRDLVVYTSQGNIFRNISLPDGPQAIEYILSVPNVAIRQARMYLFVKRGLWRGFDIYVGSSTPTRVDEGPNILDITSATAYGERKIFLRPAKGIQERFISDWYGPIAFDFFTDGSPGEFVLLDINRKPVAYNTKPCKSILELHYPFAY